METQRLSLNTSLKNANIFEDDSSNDSSYEVCLQEISGKRNNMENENISSKVANMGLKTPSKNEESVVQNYQVNAKRPSFKQRKFPYSKDKETIINQKTPKKRESSETIFETASKVIKMSTKLNTNVKQNEIETDEEILNRRQKQIDFGKNTVGYDNYIKLVPKEKRELEDPLTPNKTRMYSRRGFDGLIKQWRLKLHKYDEAEDNSLPE